MPRAFGIKLDRGAHGLPSREHPELCINEAAVIAAGLPYRPVGDVKDFPACFSKPIGYFALELDEMMPPKVCQRRLMPFVCRIAGTRGSARIEKKRIVHICRGLERITFGRDIRYEDYTIGSIGFLVGHVKDEADYDKPYLWSRATQILHEAILLGPHPVVDSELAAQRFNRHLGDATLNPSSVCAAAACAFVQSSTTRHDRAE
jgi:hypothetical protein